MAEAEAHSGDRSNVESVVVEAGVLRTADLSVLVEYSTVRRESMPHATVVASTDGRVSTGRPAMVKPLASNCNSDSYRAARKLSRFVSVAPESTTVGVMLSRPLGPLVTVLPTNAVSIAWAI